MNEDEFNQVIQKLKEIESSLAFTVNLTPKDIKKLFLLGNKSLAFVEATSRYAKENPKLFPAYIDSEEFKMNLKLFKQLQAIGEIVTPLAEKVYDTKRAVGSAAFAKARSFYKSVRDASLSGIAGCDSIADDLSRRFAQSRKPSNNEEDNQTPD
jgi:hypothetical protein